MESTDPIVDVLSALSSVIDPDLKKDIVTCGFVHDVKIDQTARSISFELRLTTPACPVRDELKAQCDAALRTRFDWVNSIDINITAAKAGSHAQRIRGLKNVSNLIAVASCKGGVGKSTVAVNLAFAIAQSGATVGVFDADVHGPSLPAMLTVNDATVRNSKSNPEMFLPFECGGVKLMSFGFIKPDSSAVMRGPMLSRVINQLLSNTEWGSLDYLIIDMPPGTGDVQLTLTQIVPITCAVIVTTPHTLSLIDVEKGLDMFARLQVPTAAVVQNMAYFVCDNCDKKHEIFGPSAASELLRCGVAHVIDIPVFPPLTDISSDFPMPFMHSHRAVDADGVESPSLAEEDGDAGTERTQAESKSNIAAEMHVSRSFSVLVGNVVREVSRLRFADDALPKVMYDPTHGKKAVVVVLPKDGAVLELNPRELRDSCTCADCNIVRSAGQVSGGRKTCGEIYPTEISPTGNYAVSINWSDGHSSSIYPYEMLIRLGRGGEAPVAAACGSAADW